MFKLFSLFLLFFYFPAHCVELTENPTIIIHSSPESFEIPLYQDTSEPTTSASCSISTPASPTIGILPHALQHATQTSCELKEIASSFFPYALALHQELWCSDPLLLKRRLRTSIIESQREYDFKYRQFIEQKSKQDSEILAQESSFPKLYTFLQRINSSLVKMIPKKPYSIRNSIPLFNLTPPDPDIREYSNYWTQKEFEYCKDPDPSMGPSIVLISTGSISQHEETCSAYLVEFRFLTGRYGSKSISTLMAPHCSFYNPPSPSSLAELLLQPQIYNPRLLSTLKRYQWTGSLPRSF